MPKLIPELLDVVSKSEDKVVAITAAATENPAIVDILKVCYDPTWEFNLPSSYPENFKLDETTPPGLSITEIIKERRKLLIFQKHGPYATLDQDRRETIFLNFLESLHYREAEVLVFAKDHALTELYPWLDQTLYNKLFKINVVEPEPKSTAKKAEEVVEVAPVEEAVKEQKEPNTNESGEPVEKPKRRGRPKKSDSK